jgi:thioredoxin-related protein
MNRIILLFILCLVMQPASAGAPVGYPFHTFDKAMQQAVKEGKPIFVYFGRYGCGYCEKTNKEAFTSKQVRDLYTRNYVLAYVDSESGKRLRLPSGERITEREVGTRYNAFVTPVFTFLTPDGQPIYQLVGVQRVEDFLDANKQVQQKISGMSKP